MFDRSDDVTYPGVISGNGSLIATGGGTLTLTGDNTFTGGTIVIGTMFPFPMAQTLQVGDGGTSGSIVGDVDNRGSLIFNRADNVIYAGVISDDGSLIKLGGGKLTLTGDNSYTGQTTVEEGTLLINGMQTGGGDYMVAPDGTLGGTGGITGNVASDGKVAPGASIGTLSVHGSMTMQADSVFEVEVSDTLSDLLAINGAATLDGTLKVSLIDGFTPVLDQQYTILTATNIVDNGLTLSAFRQPIQSARR